MPNRVFRKVPSRAALFGHLIHGLVLLTAVALTGCSATPPAATSGPATTPDRATPVPPTGQPREPELKAHPEEVAELPEMGEVETAPPATGPTGPRAAGNAARSDAGRLAEALEAYESAEVFWQGGDFDDAFAALDRAYALIVAVDPEGAADDPTIAQDKDNLRRMISRRLVEIYASRQTTVGDLDRSIPLVVNDEVRYEIRRFQGPERQFFLESYRRSGLYRPMIVAELAKAGLPEQLSWLPLVESGFKTRAYSSARALGLWQFISSTGARYDLERGSWIDERMDPEASTRAAIGYLTDLHGLFGDWMTALAGYNCGEGRVLRAMQRQPVAYFDHFWDLYQELPRETRRYVPRFLAVLAILDDPQAHGFAELPEPYTPTPTEPLVVSRPLKLAAVDAALGLPVGTLAELNPALRERATPPRPYTLRVPAGAGPDVAQRVAAVEEWAEAPAAFATHRVRRGDTLSRVASVYGASVGEIVKLNRLRSAHRISPGQSLRVPDRRNGHGPSQQAVAAAVGNGTGEAAVREARVQVRPGDSLWVLARRHGTTADRIRRDNGLSGNLLRPGQELLIRTGQSTNGSAAVRPYTVRRGDTLGGIARRQGVSLAKLLRENRLSKRSTIFPGQTLQIPN